MKDEDEIGAFVASDEAFDMLGSKIKATLFVLKLHTAAKYCGPEPTAPKDRVAHTTLHLIGCQLEEVLNGLRTIHTMYDNPDPMSEEAADAIVETGEELLNRIMNEEDFMQVLDLSYHARDAGLVGMEDMPEFLKKAFAEGEK